MKPVNLEAIKGDITDDLRKKNICMENHTTKSTDKSLFCKICFQGRTKDQWQKYIKNFYKLIKKKKSSTSANTKVACIKPSILDYNYKLWVKEEKP